MIKKRPGSISYSKNENPVIEIKVILIGDPGVGKTNIINRFLSQEFNPSCNPTLGSSFGEKIIKKEKNIYKLKIWDTTGEEKYRSITKLFIKASHIVLLVYSIDNLESFHNLDIWYNYIDEQLSESDYILAIVGNKKDLILSEVVTDEEGKNYAEKKGAFFQLTSAKCDEEGIISLFEKLLDELIKKYGERIMNDSLQMKNIKKEKKNCC